MVQGTSTVERQAENLRVDGSNPSPGTKEEQANRRLHRFRKPASLDRPWEFDSLLFRQREHAGNR